MSVSIQLLLNWNVGSSGRAYPATQQEYLTGSGSGGGGGATISAGIGYAFANGYHYFDLAPGQYTVDIQGAEGSGNQHGYGAIITANLVVKTQTRFVAIVGNPGSSSYGGGGMSALALRNASTDIYTTAIPVLVAGGGGGGYSIFHSHLDAGDTTWNPTARRGLNTDRADGRGGTYDGGASFNNNYNTELYSSSEGGQGSAAAQHWVWGARGGIQSACGAVQGGFGGGGGGCPAGGGGYYGGKPGGNSPTNYGGGGGTSYRLSEDNDTAYISTWSDVGPNGTGRTTTSGTAGGKLTVTYTAPYVAPVPGITSNVSAVVSGGSVELLLRTATEPGGNAVVPYTITGVLSTDITVALTGSITTTNNIGNLIIGTVAAPADSNTRSFPNNAARIGGSFTVTPINNSNTQVTYTSFNNQKLRTQSNREIAIGRSLLYGKVNGYSESTTAILTVDADRTRIVNNLGVANITTALDPMVYFVITSVPAVTSIGVKTDRGVGFFEQGETGYYRAITDQNDPRPIVIPGTAVSGPKQYWY